MRIRTPFLILVLAAASVASAHSPSLLTAMLGQTTSTPKAPIVETGRLYVKIKPGKLAAATAAIRAAGGTVVKSFPQINWVSVQLPTNISVTAAQSKLKGNANLVKTEPSYKRYFLETPNDPLRVQQWSLPVLRLPEAWTLTHGNPNVVVAVIDSGFDVGHPDYAGVLLPGTNFGDGAADDLTDIVGHGTHVAGTVGAATNNAIGIAGNAWGSMILPLKVATAAGGVSHDGLINAILHAGDVQAQVANISIGGYGLDTVEEDAINYANSRGVLVVAAAGNDKTSLKSYPGAFEKVLCVGATDRGDIRASFSNFGADWVDVAAPGVDILSLYPRTMSTTGYELLDGTSMASPNVAGVASLVFARYANAGATTTNDEVRQKIEDTCVPIGTWLSKGRVDAFEAVLATGSPLVDTPTPTDPVAFEGNVSSLDGALLEEDGNSMTIRSIKKGGVGLSGAGYTTFALSSITADEVTKASLTFAVKGDSVSTIQVFFQGASGAWTMYTTTPGTAAMKTVTLNLTKATLNKYLVDDKVNVLIRALVPQRLASKAKGITEVDRISMTFTGVRFGSSVAP